VHCIRLSLVVYAVVVVARMTPETLIALWLEGAFMIGIINHAISGFAVRRAR
jgi:hypothetical protein